MSKFKAGDKVKVVAVKKPQFWYAGHIGKEFTLAQEEDCNWYVDEDPTGLLWEGDIELINSEWNGSGNPAVGTICEAYNTSIGWFPVKILHLHPKNDGILACMNLSLPHILFWSDTFRPLKTKEEIEREESIAEMDVDLEYLGDDESLAEHLISKGWRKK